MGYPPIGTVRDRREGGETVGEGSKSRGESDGVIVE